MGLPETRIAVTVRPSGSERIHVALKQFLGMHLGDILPGHIDRPGWRSRHMVLVLKRGRTLGGQVRFRLAFTCRAEVAVSLDVHQDNACTQRPGQPRGGGQHNGSRIGEVDWNQQVSPGTLPIFLLIIARETGCARGPVDSLAGPCLRALHRRPAEKGTAIL